MPIDPYVCMAVQDALTMVLGLLILGFVLLLGFLIGYGYSDYENFHPVQIIDKGDVNHE